MRNMSDIWFGKKSGVTVYRMQQIRGTTPAVDVGTAEEVMERAELTGRGRYQKPFVEAAKGHKVLRVGYDLIILTKAEAKEIALRLMSK